VAAKKKTAKKAAKKKAAKPAAPKKKSAPRNKGAPRKAAPRKSAPKKAATRKAASKAGSERLARYREMRDFAKTPEPAEDSARGAGNAFVVQKHDATRLHYDFRLEHDGALLSWAVPKGPSLRAGERRLAVRTEDHPLSYADFEGIIPKGEYGGGSVIVWDRGTWQPEGDTDAALRKGRLTFSLAGDKLHGRFHLVRTKPSGKQDQWLLFKSHDDAASDVDIVDERPESALSGRTVEQVAEAPGRVWHSNKSEERGATKDAKQPPAQGDVVALVAQLPVKVKFTNLDKLLYPEGFRKADLVAYYAAVSSRLLPHVAGRPLTIVRYPEGRTGHGFFQKHANQSTPATVKRVPVEEDGKTEQYLAIDDLDGLLALPQLGVLELHTWVAHDPERPDQLVFDLDPDEALPWDAVVQAALHMRDALAELELTSFVKTTGGKGLHVVLPVTPKHDWDTHRAFAKGISETLARAHPKLYLTNMRKDLRKGKLFLDYLRNGRGATAIAPYSTRAREGATVATPLSWQELEQGVHPKDFTIRTLMKRIDAPEEPWAAYARTKQALGARQLRAVGVR
jgi:bifunctional non-homologous end joining protein LigD